MRWVRTTLGVLALALLGSLAVADEAASPELDAALELKQKLSAAEQSLIDGLRYLMRPEFEADLFKGRRYRPAPLPSYEAASGEAFTQLEVLRVWAVLESGMPLTAATDGHLRRMLSMPVPATEVTLGPAAARMLTLRAALMRDDARSRDALKQRATDLLKAAQESKDAASANSKLIADGRTDPQWFANHLWRGTMLRAARDIGIEHDVTLWQNDLRALCRSWTRREGFVRQRGLAGLEATLDTNLLGMAALSIALSAPDGMLSAATKSAVERQAGECASQIEQWGEGWKSAHFSGARIALLQTLADQFAPLRANAAEWRQASVARAVAFPDPRGAIHARGGLMSSLGLLEPGWVREQAVAAETAFAVVGLAGGLLRPGKGMLADHTLASIGRYLFAFAMVHAEHERDLGGSDFNQRVKFAIDDGCAFLERMQKEDGTFQGRWSAQPGNTAISVLALLHGGYGRDSQALQRGLEAVVKQCDDATARNGVGTYNIGLVLMMLQKYYEPEQREAGLFSAAAGEEFEKARAEVRKRIPRPHLALVDELVSQLNRSMPASYNGGWGYYPLKDGGKENSDNSCSQFAILGYKAASTLGGRVDGQVFKRESQRLIDQYAGRKDGGEMKFKFSSGEGKTAVMYEGTIAPGGWSYRVYKDRASGDSMQMTAAGISTLAICIDELKSRDELEPRAEFEIALRIHGAQGRLAQTYYTGEGLIANDGAPMRTAADGTGTYYNLYSVERGCELAGIKMLDGVIDWYVIGADALLDYQNVDGSWSGEAAGTPAGQNLINTSMAILFLKRAALPVFTDLRKRAHEKPKDPVTGDKAPDEDPAKAAE